MKWFHAIGICGKATGNVAKMFKDMGWFVTGSDLQYFPPMSEQLDNWEIPTVEGYHFSHLTKEFWQQNLGKTKLEIGEYPDLCLVIDTATPLNKEYLFAKKKGLDIRPYSQILGEYLVKPESIVVIGTAGKTTTTSLLVRILQELKMNPSYMIGAEVLDIPDSLKNTKSNWSVMEGDEYHNPDISKGAKFLEYKPKYLVITNIGWEHQDIFPTQERYIEEFTKAANLIPDDGLIVVPSGDKYIEQAIKNAKSRVIRYKLIDDLADNKISGSVVGGSTKAGVLFSGSEQTIEQSPKSEMKKEDSNVWSVTKSGRVNTIKDNTGDVIIKFQTSLLGDYNLENILAAVIVIMNTPPEVPSRNVDEDNKMFMRISETIRNFKGPKKRLEILHRDEKLVVVDDFGVAPHRAGNSLKTLRKEFPSHKIVAIFEPNAGSRITDLGVFNELYKSTFIEASEVIIPDLSTTNEELITAEEMTKRLIDLGFNAKNVPSELLLSHLTELKNSNDKLIVVFFSSYRLTKIAEEFSS